jgi:ribosome-associated heat shock protein Hsp15
VLTFPQGARIRVVRILAIGLRRGPASEAQMLYLDLDAQKDMSEPLE